MRRVRGRVSVLADILASKRREVEALKARPRVALDARAASTWSRALRRAPAARCASSPR